MLQENTHTLIYTVKEEDAGMSILDALYKRMKASGRVIRSAKRRKDILLNGNAVSVNARVRKGDQLALRLLVEPNIFEPEDIPVAIAFEDMDMIAVNKQPFLVVHPTKNHPYGTLANGLSKYFKDNDMDFKIRFINRLDRDTTGLMLVAKNGFAQQMISDQMQNNQVEKIYYAVVKGRLEKDAGTINEPIGLATPDGIARSVFADGQPSVTHYKVVERFEDATLVEVLLETGRTHQIRVHFQHVGHPLVGDELYGSVDSRINRQALHCIRMSMAPVRGQGKLNLEAPLPEDMKALLEDLRQA